jgi:hypothetical protein
MRNAQSKRIMVRKLRGALASCLLVNIAILGLLTTDAAIGQTCTPAPPIWLAGGQETGMQTIFRSAIMAPYKTARRPRRAKSDKHSASAANGDGAVIPHKNSLNPQSPGFTAGFWMKGFKNQPESLATMSLDSRALIILLLCAVTSSIFAGTLLGLFHPETQGGVSQRTLTFAEHVAHQRAIQDVYWRHRTSEK